MNRLLAILPVLAGMLLVACSPVPRRAAEDPAAVLAYEARARILAPMTHWEITGRLAITDGEEGGSGALNWVQDGARTEMSFRGTLGQGSWQLEADDARALLRLADGQQYVAPDVSELVHAQVGWNVPVDALAYWVRGLAADSSWQDRRLDDSGRITHLLQSGWEVEFGNYREHDAKWLPSRLIARRGAYAVKMVIKGWRLESGAGHLE